ncbi:MAG: SUMF1/EgtB/PvdO family nonheme iron enzyme [Lentimicrobiaceae bacterium]|nr:SUMF1/EgtB/PvdO family nonheme iron enzyme [Lentimicrobiaceae bacterium]
MKRNLFYFIVVVALLIVAAVACNKDKAVTGVTIDYNELELFVGETATLYATVSPSDAANKIVSWTSDNPDVVSVIAPARGAIIARAIGEATITVTTNDGNFTARCKVTVITPTPIEPVMIRVTGGTFVMGCTDGQCQHNETPTLNVQLSDYYIAQYPVTQREWRAMMRSNPSLFKGDYHPVENINLDDIEEFLLRLNEAFPNKNYRLATEAEWEYAARGGNKSNGYKYSGSNILNDVAWHSGNSATEKHPNGQTHPVGGKNPNELDIYDMSGNVWEWCSSFYARYDSVKFRTGYDSTLNIWINPQDTAGIQHVARGGSYLDLQYHEGKENGFCRVSARYAPSPPMMPGHLGIRLAMSVE